MRKNLTLFDFVIKEWLLFTAISGVILTSIYFKKIPTFSSKELEVIFILFVLFVAVKGLELSGVMQKISGRIEQGGLIPLKLTLTSFFLSMIVTNDVAIIILVPLTLTLNIEKKGLIVILEVLAVNAGSAFTPIGNPQNLFIYWFYNLVPSEFLKTIFPFSAAFLILLIILSLFVKIKSTRGIVDVKINKRAAIIFFSLLLVVILTVMHILPVAACFAVVIYALIFNRESLRIDYALLFTFLCFFGLSENLKNLFTGTFETKNHVFLFSALASQFVSNVPAALLFSKFTTQWKELLWGTNVGGFGSPIGSLANLIAYKIYIEKRDIEKPFLFTIKFLLIGYVFFFLGIGLYFLINN